MKMEKLLKTAILCVLVFSAFLVFYGKGSVYSGTEQGLLQNSYQYVGSESYTSYYETEGVFLHDVNDTAETVMDNADAIMKVKSIETYQYGKGYVTRCLVEEVLKGEGVTEGNTIEVYNLAIDRLGFFDGCMPMGYDGEYYILVKKAESAAIKNSWYISHTYYGCMHADHTTPEYTILHEDDFISVEEMLKYDHIFEEGTDDSIIDVYTDTYTTLHALLAE